MALLTPGQRTAMACGRERRWEVRGVGRRGVFCHLHTMLLKRRRCPPGSKQTEEGGGGAEPPREPRAPCRCEERRRVRPWAPGDPSQLTLSVSRAVLSAWSPLCWTSRLFPQSASLAGLTVREPGAHLPFTQWTSIHQTPVLGHLDPEATGLTLGRHCYSLSWIRSCQWDEFSNLQMPENGARTEPAPIRTGSEGCLPLWSIFFVSF